MNKPAKKIMKLVNRTNAFNNKKKILFSISYALILFTFYLFSLNYAQAYTIGIIVGKNKTKTSTSNHEKMCILGNIANATTKQFPEVRFIFAENDRSAVGSMKAAMSLVKQHVDLALLPLISHEATPAAQILSHAGIPFITSATSVSVLKSGENGLSIMPSNKEQAAALARYYISRFKGKKIHIVVNPAKKYSVSVARLFTQYVIRSQPDTKITEYEFSPQQADEIAHAVSEGDIVFAPLYNPDIAVLYSALAANKSRKTTIIGPDSVGARKEFFAIIGKAEKQIALQFLSNWDHQLKGPNISDLTAYVKTYCHEKEPTFLSVYSYDLIQLALSQLPLLMQAKSPEESIRILQKSSYITVMDGKNMQFTRQGYNRKNFYLYEIKGKSTHLLQVLTHADL